MVELCVAEGSCVGIRVGDGGEVESWTVVRADEQSDAMRHRISAETPLARALLGRGPGDTVTVKGQSRNGTPAQSYRATIVSVQ